MVKPENDKFSSSNEENESMNENEAQQDEVMPDNGEVNASPGETGLPVSEPEISGEVPGKMENEPVADNSADTAIEEPEIPEAEAERPDNPDTAAEMIIPEPEGAVAENTDAGEANQQETENSAAAEVAEAPHDKTTEINTEPETTAESNSSHQPVSAEAPVSEVSVESKPDASQKEPVSKAHSAEKGDAMQEKPEEADHTGEDTLHEDDDEHHEDDDHHDDMGMEEEDDFAAMSKEQLLEFVNKAIDRSEERNMNKRVQQAKSEFNRMVRDEQKDALEEWKKEGNEESAFQAPEEPLWHDFNRAFKAYKKKRQEYISDLNIQKEENLAAKKEVLDKLKVLTEENENISSFSEFKKLQDEWRSIGHVPITEAENIWNSYNYYIKRFYEQRSLYSEFRELDNKRNLTAKEELVAKIEALLPMEDLNECMRMLKQYQDEWKHIGPVPKEQLEDVISRYKNAVISLYEKKEKLSEELNQRREQNYEVKLALIQKIEEIADFESTRVQDWVNKNQELGQWIENWRSVGNIPLSRGNELKERFSAALRKFNKNKNNFFRDRKREKVDNLRKKTQLCESVEALLEGDDHVAHKKEVIRLQDEWKKSGPVPLKYSDKLWKRFQAACDAFFAKIVSQQSDQDKEQYENLKLKNAIVDRIDELLKQETIEAPEKMIRSLQEEFNNIGFVPFKEKDKIRKRFFASLNNLIAKVGGGASDMGQNNDQLSYKLTIQSWGQEGAHARLENEERKHMRELKRIENEISTVENNMEFFRNSKNADDLRAKMDKQVGDLKEKMVDLQEKLKMIRHASRH